MLLLLLASFAAIIAVPYLAAVASVLRLTRGQPRYFTLFHPYHPLLSTLPYARLPHPRIFLNRYSAWLLKADLHRQCGSTIVLLVSFLTWPSVVVFVGDGKVIHQINADRKSFHKPTKANAPILSFWGFNILTAEGETWRRHRRITVSSFGERGTKQVWDVAKKRVQEWVERLGEGKRMERVEDEFSTLTLLVITEAAFGISFPWPSPSQSTTSPLFNSSKTVLRDSLLATVLPSFIMRHLPNREVRRVNTAFEHFENELKRILEERKEEILSGEADERNDLLTALVRANLAEEDAKNKLSNQELLSDAFIFVVAGHETTANALSALFLLLALYPSHQNLLHAEISAYLTSTSGAFNYPAAFNSLPYTLATVQEGLRLAGPVSAVMKRTAQDAVLDAKLFSAGEGKEGEGKKVFVKAGWEVRENVVGAHYNPEAWSDPFDFDPSRFLKQDWERESFVPFSSGLRGCVGRQMAMAEMVIVLALVTLQYRIEVPAERKEEFQLKAEEGERERRDRLLDGAWPFTMQPRGVDLVFVRRGEGEKEEQ